ncbi:MAG TPA: DUF1634 domain-containing protein [Dehalococcoidia bacterium]|nr:DUF1634 domain-containing protein [Dehalococcoidia bacterium]
MSRADPEAPTQPQPRHQMVSIETASSWVLRVGVIASVVVMMTGLVLGLARGSVTVSEMEHREFSGHPSSLWHGVTSGSGFAVMEVGLLILVLTPIVRVGTAMLLFAFEDHDWVYTAVTALVLTMTLAALLLLR